MRTALSWMFLPLALAQIPDRQPMADEWGYRPAERAIVALNPPSFSWVMEQEAAGYTLQWADNAEFTGAVTVRSLPWTVHTHSAPLKPGVWWWRYRIAAKDRRESPWSRPRTFTVPANAVVFPQPTMEELRKRIPSEHPRLFVRPEDMPKLKQRADSKSWRKLIARADELAGAEPTPEPAVRGNARDPETQQYWWSNRVQTVQALQEAEILAFAWLLTRDPKYGNAARRFTLKLAAWDPDGPTNFALNCEAAKPMLHRLARAYDWAWPLFSEDERANIRATLLRRAMDAWNTIAPGTSWPKTPSPRWAKHRNRRSSCTTRSPSSSPPIRCGPTTMAAGTRACPT